ncbi:MAG: hypothetical protein FJ207_14030 [Gemmatimonadetes bacterium]|nr:hypothetical protein [Gemmatimonadota bacterium]
MRKLTSFALAAAVLFPAGVAAQATLTANVGYMSQYYFRGILQKPSSASAGLTVASSDLSAGTWAADVGKGSEVDFFASYAIPVGSGNVSFGGTGYFYTDDFDNTYLEGNFGAAFGPISLAGALGTYDDGNDTKYFFLSVTAAQNGLFATAGALGSNTGFGDALSDAFDTDLGGQYLQAGYGFTAGEMDFSVSGLLNDTYLSDEVDGELTLIFQASKTFTISGS